MEAPLLAIQDLAIEFRVPAGAAGPGDARTARWLRAVDAVSFGVAAGRSVGVVGESGCGKSTTALSILRLLPAAGRIAAGRVLFRRDADGPTDLVRLDEKRLRALRGDRIAMIFQEPATSLDPVFTVGDQVGEPLRIHRHASRRAARDQAVRLLSLVGIPDPGRCVDEYPHQLSGGLRQRVMIAIALACGPDLLIADEPTSALDATIQAQILDLLARLRRELKMAVLLITHDLGVVADACDDVVVMYAGQVVERAAAAAALAAPRHPYTAGLLDALPRASSGPGGRADGRGRRLPEIPGMVPRLDALQPGCRFAERCPRAAARCRAEAPALAEAGPGHVARCHFAADASWSPRARS